MSVVYALKVDETQRIFYVGKTSKHPDARLNEHLRGARKHKTRKVYVYIREALARGHSISVNVLESAPEEKIIDLEQSWIETLRRDGHPLTNVVRRNPRPGHTSVHAWIDDETVQLLDTLILEPQGLTRSAWVREVVKREISATS